MTVQHHALPGKYKLTIDDFMRLDRTGVFGAERTELLDGDIIIMNAEYRPHAWIVGEIGYQLRRALESAGTDLHVMTASVALSDHDMPLPDIVLTREPRGHGPIPSDSVALLVEVSSTTLHKDLRDKLAIYARAAVPEYWVVDGANAVIHQMWSPQNVDFSQRRMFPLAGRITAETIPGLTIDLSRI